MPKKTWDKDLRVKAATKSNGSSTSCICVCVFVCAYLRDYCMITSNETKSFPTVFKLFFSIFSVVSSTTGAFFSLFLSLENFLRIFSCCRCNFPRFYSLLHLLNHACDLLGLWSCWFFFLFSFSSILLYSFFFCSLIYSKRPSIFFRQHIIFLLVHFFLLAFLFIALFFLSIFSFCHSNDHFMSSHIH